MSKSRSQELAKRIFDVTLASCLGILLLPLLILTALWIKYDSAGPVIFTQRRIGLNNRPFLIFKFRTLSTLEDGPVIRQVTHNDPRLTRIGQFLRRHSIDELPQLINVLKGDMSLVGPRPHAIAHNVQYAASIENYVLRHQMKPGLTGWAQINGLRGETRTLEAMQRRVDFDVWYIDNWSFWLDCKIALRTFFEMLRLFSAHDSSGWFELTRKRIASRTKI
jgi:exopolysaccharide biosynthesis polyprenyl glycosylphosphotransferase